MNADLRTSIYHLINFIYWLTLKEEYTRLRWDNFVQRYAVRAAAALAALKDAARAAAAVQGTQQTPCFSLTT